MRFKSKPPSKTIATRQPYNWVQVSNYVYFRWGVWPFPLCTGCLFARFMDLSTLLPLQNRGRVTWERSHKSLYEIQKILSSQSLIGNLRSRANESPLGPPSPFRSVPWMTTSVSSTHVSASSSSSSSSYMYVSISHMQTFHKLMPPLLHLPLIWVVIGETNSPPHLLVQVTNERCVLALVTSSGFHSVVPLGGGGGLAAPRPTQYAGFFQQWWCPSKQDGTCTQRPAGRMAAQRVGCS
jgi:hypothetical protein